VSPGNPAKDTLGLDRELLRIANELDEFVGSARSSPVLEKARALKAAAEMVGRAFSGSWLGYHANVYYENLNPPPPGAHFSQQWGLETTYPGNGTRGHWQECDPERVKAYIRQFGQGFDTEAKTFVNESDALFDRSKAEVLSIITTENDGSDGYLQKITKDLESLRLLAKSDIIAKLCPTGQIMTGDTVAIGQGLRTPPHIEVSAEAFVVQASVSTLETLSKLTRQAGSHIDRKKKTQSKMKLIGTNVFIGHGRSLLWRELKDFIEERIRLPTDEFNRVPVAGVTNIARLSEMLDAAAIAFLVMTAEDESKDGKFRARTNVVHEAGLFQGRLGFNRAIVVLEDSCEEFSNIEGLGQIRFPAGNIKAAFEEVRQVLEREGLTSSGRMDM
jgi:predicted nucleotide-binding protein